MPCTLRLWSALSLVMAVGACSDEPGTDMPTSPGQPAAIAPAATDATPTDTVRTDRASGETVDYRCDDGSSVQVRYADHQAHLVSDTLDVRLPKAESASKGPGEVYIGREVSLLRENGHIQLHDAGSSLQCAQR